MNQNESSRIAADILIAFIGSQGFVNFFTINDTYEDATKSLADAFKTIREAVDSPSKK